MLKIKLFRGFVLVVAIFGILSTFVAMRTIKRRVVDDAQSRVRLDLSGAWHIYNSRLNELEVIARITAGKQAVGEFMQAPRESSSDEVGHRLENIRMAFGLDFLDLVAPDGRVVLRTTPPFVTGDFRTSDPAVASALKGKPTTCMTLLSRQEMEREAEGLAEKAYLEIEDTPHARRTERKVETRGMFMVSAVPIMSGTQLLGAVHGGILINRNHALVDRIHDVIYRNEQYKGLPMGTATIFLHDSRISTTVRQANGNRALGSRVSKQVADQVLDNGRLWLGEAFVVKDRYLSAYEPIRDGWGEIIGMLYVGIQKRPFQDYARGMAMRYIGLTLFVMLIALAIAFITAGRLTAPIHRLVEASKQMSSGRHPGQVSCEHACHETSDLIHAFNEMTAALAERESRLKALNRSYMEMLGFVAHELKSPLGTMMNYLYLMREGKMGPTTDGQQRALKNIDGGIQRIVEMVRHYLNLSRIENGEMAPMRTRLQVAADVILPLIEAAEAEIEHRRMRVANRVGADILLHADANMVREVFENLISNAVKYGSEGGTIVLDAGPEAAFVRFRVRNEGEGISEDKMPQLFDKFVRLNGTPATRRQKGTGLGLFITKNIVEAHGGTIRAISKPGEWVEFDFTLPRWTEAEKEQDASETSGTTG